MQNPPPVQVSSQPPAKAGKSSTGLDENIAALLSYVFGWVSGLIFFLIEKTVAWFAFTRCSRYVQCCCASCIRRSGSCCLLSS
jgi:hypothetical protein